MNNKSDNGHIHDDRYFTEYETNNLVNDVYDQINITNANFNNLMSNLNLVTSGNLVKQRAFMANPDWDFNDLLYTQNPPGIYGVLPSHTNNPTGDYGFLIVMKNSDGSWVYVIFIATNSTNIRTNFYNSFEGDYWHGWNNWR